MINLFSRWGNWDQTGCVICLRSHSQEEAEWGLTPVCVRPESRSSCHTDSLRLLHILETRIWLLVLKQMCPTRNPHSIKAAGKQTRHCAHPFPPRMCLKLSGRGAVVWGRQSQASGGRSSSPGSLPPATQKYRQNVGRKRKCHDPSGFKILFLSVRKHHFKPGDF